MNPDETASVETAVDPVCAAVVNTAAAAQVYTYHDTTFYFDSVECFKRFLSDPEKYSQPLTT